MKHRIGFNRLGRKSSHRKAMQSNMVISLFRSERIQTTKAKAKEVRRVAEKMITRAKVDSVHNRRIIAKQLGDKEILSKLFTDISPRFITRPGGYTRILKTGYRQGDAAEMVLLELVVKAEAEAKTKGKKKAEEKAGAEKADKNVAKAAKKASEEPVEAVAAAEASPQTGQSAELADRKPAADTKDKKPNTEKPPVAAKGAVAKDEALENQTDNDALKTEAEKDGNTE